ncbi:FliA/WhiG family RNA polymerase sigma factor [Pelagicoccus mobilis]|uniref:FliA/WhiG family RNA polymerase sigma factor n=1 Tax=Pelagicoccus mobilis TaxID=415221 RepID=A0A934VSF2_9BACT|nr:FliA/WhiG family RNA polymerase sigma factor [Pelagicoccus mobilis]MBK1878449.1 FliA/WhiG family RNA polymerase sigma factor [Pelagicoccus mobilis]
MNDINVKERKDSSKGKKAQAAKAYGVGDSAKPPVQQAELFETYMPLVRSIVARIKINLPPHIDEQDLHSVGITGLIAALKKYDPAQKKSFGSYAAMRIRGSILDELRRMDWMPRNARTNFKKLRATIEEVEQRLGRPATEEEIRNELGLSHKEYDQLMAETRPVSFLPLDNAAAGGDDGEGADLYEVIPDDNVMPVTNKMEKDEVTRLVAERINQLPETPRKVLAMYYFQDMRLAEIAEVFGLTESRICQIHSQAIISLRSYITNVMHK